jgi:cytochrome c-type biogenesis protein CcmH/NrfG
MAVRLLIVLTLAIGLQIVPDAAQTPEATSLFGRPLVSTTPTGEDKARLDANLARAQADYDRDPASADAAIWLGRRFAYLGRFRDAIDAYTRGIERHRNEPRRSVSSPRTMCRSRPRATA